MTPDTSKMIQSEPNAAFTECIDVTDVLFFEGNDLVENFMTVVQTHQKKNLTVFCASLDADVRQWSKRGSDLERRSAWRSSSAFSINRFVHWKKIRSNVISLSSLTGCPDHSWSQVLECRICCSRMCNKATVRLASDMNSPDTRSDQMKQGTVWTMRRTNQKSANLNIHPVVHLHDSFCTRTVWLILFWNRITTKKKTIMDMLATLHPSNSSIHILS